MLPWFKFSNGLLLKNNSFFLGRTQKERSIWFFRWPVPHLKKRVGDVLLVDAPNTSTLLSELELSGFHYYVMGKKRQWIN